MQNVLIYFVVALSGTVIETLMIACWKGEVVLNPFHIGKTLEMRKTWLGLVLPPVGVSQKLKPFLTVCL